MTLRSSLVKRARPAKPAPKTSWQSASDSQRGIALILSYARSQPLTAVAIRLRMLLCGYRRGQTCGSIRKALVAAVAADANEDQRHVGVEPRPCLDHADNAAN